MSVRESAKYVFGLPFVRFMPLNDNLTIPVPTRMLGGGGPFDFSGVDNIAAVPLIIKFDNEAAVTYTLDLSGAVSAAAVTVEELYAAINSENPADITASEDPTTHRIRLVYDGSDTVEYVQVYGDAAKIALFGQGLGLKFIKSDTMQSFGDAPLLKDEETISVTDAKGLDTTIISDGYRKGCTITGVDTAIDWELRQLLEGGHYDEEEGEYETPTSEDDKAYFYVEIFYPVYLRGENKEADIVGYRKKLVRTAKGAMGDMNHAREFALGNFTINATSYKDEAGNLYGDQLITELTVIQYEALDVYNV